MQLAATSCPVSDLEDDVPHLGAQVSPRNWFYTGSELRRSRHFRSISHPPSTREQEEEGSLGGDGTCVGGGAQRHGVFRSNGHPEPILRIRVLNVEVVPIAAESMPMKCACSDSMIPWGLLQPNEQGTESVCDLLSTTRHPTFSSNGPTFFNYSLPYNAFFTAVNAGFVLYCSSYKSAAPSPGKVDGIQLSESTNSPVGWQRLG